MIFVSRRQALAAAAGFSALGLAGLRAQAQAKFFRIGTGGTGGTYYPVGGLIGNAISTGKINVSAVATNGSVANINAIVGGSLESGFSQADVNSWAFTATGIYEGKPKVDELRAIANLYPETVHVVIKKGLNIKTLADLKGKAISVGAPKSGTELNARAILAAAGLSYKDFSKVEYLPFGESVELMKNRQLDVTLQSAGLGVSALRDLATSVDIIVVPIPPDVIKKTNDPAYLAATIPANTYRGQTADVPSAAVQNYLVTSDGVSPDIVYSMTKALWSNLDGLVAAHSAAKAIDLKHALEGMPIPLHPGAEKYYKEVGLIK